MKAGKVWGSTELLLQTPFVELHRIYVRKGGFCSTHMHQRKWNLFYVIFGELDVHVYKNDYDLKDTTHLHEGDWTTVKPGEFHSFEGVIEVDALELYYPETLSEDIIRKSVGGFKK
tara:strand:+ start:2673 stop:3020 length:348 start_codon:yes stop_codon:yes gene_type:complete